MYKNGIREFLGEEIDLVKSCLRKTMDRDSDSDSDIVSDPWPARDITDPKGNSIWSFYSDERLLERTNTIYVRSLADLPRVW